MPGRDCPWPLAALLALLVTTMGTPAQALEASTAADLDGLLGRVAGILAREGVPGAGLALVDRGGTAWAGGVGTTEPGGGRAVDADTPFRVGSVSKTITAIAVMRLVEDRRLSLDATLAEAAPDVPFENPWEAGRPVRVAHLLEHTAGFEFCGFNEWFDDRPEPRTLLEALQVNPRSRRVRWPPGSRVSYSNEGYLAAGRILERATGLPFDAAVRDLALAPLGMTSSAFQAAPPLRARLAPGHGWPERPGVRVAYEDDMMRPAANLITTPRDASRLVSLFLGRGTLDGRAVLGPAAIDRMERRLTLPFAGPEEQFGIGLETFQAGGLLGFGHVGVTYGYEAAFRYLPSAGVGWAVLLNGAGSGPRRAREAIEAEILAFLSRGAPPPPVPRPAPASREELAALAGFYREATPAQELLAPLTTLGGVEVAADDRGLSLRWVRASSIRSHLPGAGGWERLEPAGDGSFRRQGETATSFAFVRASGDVPALATAGGLLVRAPRWAAAARWWLLLCALGVTVSAVALTPSLVAAWRAGAHRPLAWVEALLVATALAVVAMGVLVWLSPQPWGRPNTTTVAFWALSWLLGVLPVLALGATLARVGEGASLAAKSYTLLAVISATGLSMFAWRSGWVGLQTWRW